MIAFVGLGSVWWLNRPEPIAPDAPAPSVATAGDAGAPPESRALRWLIEGREPIEASDLQTCLASQPVDDARVSGARGTKLLVFATGVATPQTVEPGPPIVVNTPVQTAHRHATLLHLATVACLQTDGATLVDPVLDRRFSGDDWPAPSARGGLPVGALFDATWADGRWTSRGLARLGLPELGLKGPQTPAAERLLQQAVAAWFVGGERETLTAGDTQLRAQTSPEWWEGDATVRVLTAADGQPAQIPVATTPNPLPSAELPTPNRVERPQPARKPATRVPRRSARPVPRTKPKPVVLPPPPKGPRFRPAYR